MGKVALGNLVLRLLWSLDVGPWSFPPPAFTPLLAIERRKTKFPLFMTLSPEQKQAVASWVAAGDNLSAVQKKLAEQFKISMTYRDVRFLVDDLNLALKDPAPKVDASDVSKAQPRPAAGRPEPVERAEKKGMIDRLKEKVGLAPGAVEEDDLPPEDLPESADDFPAEPAGAGSLTVELDRVMRPGFMVSGSVTFSDGVSGKWALDQMGRLMLETPQKGYQPSPADVQAFQRELQVQLQRQGF